MPATQSLQVIGLDICYSVLAWTANSNCIASLSLNEKHMIEKEGRGQMEGKKKGWKKGREKKRRGKRREGKGR